MGRITMELLRKRSEHNEGEIHSLEELALHQEKLENIELIDKVCRNLKILLLQNNAISKIENLGRLKTLEYLNLALNIVEKVENLEGCESLTKLDLTLNFVMELTSVKSLSGLRHLEQLYLVGNPCHDFSGYRDYVISALPQLKSLDGREITKTERIQACQNHDELEKIVIQQQEKHSNLQPGTQGHENLELTSNESADSVTCEKTYNGDNDNSGDEDDSEFWAKQTANTPQVRKEMIKRLEKQDERKKPKDTKKIKKSERKLTTADGKPLNINQAKVSFSLHDECDRSQLVLDLAVPKFMCTTLIDADVQPFHVKVTMKGKIFQLVLPEEVKPDSSFAQRSQTTGHLIITMPKVLTTSFTVWRGAGGGEVQQIIDLTNSGVKSAPGTSNKGKPVGSRGSVSTLRPKLSSNLSPRNSVDSCNKVTSSPTKARKGILKKSTGPGKTRVHTAEYDVPPLL